MASSYICYGCKQRFNASALVLFCTAKAQAGHRYCATCLKKAQSSEMFSNAVCKIFGIKAPGPRIWSERKRLVETYGYTDNVIIKTLYFLYEVKKINHKSESLYRITPEIVEAALKYWTDKKEENEQFAKTFITSIQEYTTINNKKRLVQIKEKTINNDIEPDWDAFFNEN